MGSLGQLIYTLQVLLGTTFSYGSLGGLVLLYSSEHLILALGLVHVGDGYVDVLLDDTAIDKLLDGNTDSTLVHVKDDTGTTMVVLVGHTLVDGRVDLQVNIVSSL